MRDVGMNSRERVLAALNHQEPDRVPFDLCSNASTGIHRIAYSNLRKGLGLLPSEPAIMHLGLQIVWVEEDVHDKLKTDFRGIRSNPASGWTLELHEDDSFRWFTDESGITRHMPLPDGLYYDLCNSPLAEATTPDDVAKHPLFPPDDPGRFVGMKDRAAEIRALGKAVVLGGSSGGILEASQWLRGYENMYCDLAANQPLAEALFDRILEFKMAYWTRAMQEIGEYVDVINEGDDYGGQNGLLMSARMWRKLLKPRLRTLFAHIKSCAPHVKILLHSCGSIREIIPELIEVGVDALNPVQVAAAGMNTRELKRDFGKDITFWGGGVDTQYVLPTGTPQQVRDEVRRRFEDLSPGGGFVFAAVHNIQADVPPENIVAMREELLACGACAD